MAIYVYNIDNGELVSYCPDDSDQVASPEELQANGLTSGSGLPPLDETHVWDAAQRAVVRVPAPVKPRPVSTAKWILRFTPQEWLSFVNSDDLAIQHFILALRHTTEIDLSDPNIIWTVGYLVDTANLLDLSRVPDILAA
jgi:hypothetical protein